MIKQMVFSILLILVPFFLGFPVLAVEEYFTVKDEAGQVIFYTGEYVITPGDRYINQKNQEFLIYSVDEEKREAVAQDRGYVDLLGYGEEEDFLSSLPHSGPLFAGGGKKIAIYHTHSEESYVPTSGTHEKPGEGDIFAVGERFKEELERMKITVFHSLTAHEPRDAASYDRSKSTAKKLMEKGPDAIFDIHRDGVPNREEYTTEIGGEKTSMVTFVVGRQNPNMAVVEDFAKELKAAADKIEPGLIKGILFANGKYNQELSSHALLLEIGTHLSSLEEAERGATLLAGVVGEFFYGEGEAQAPAARHAVEQQRSALITIFYLVAVVVIGVLLFLYINEGSWKKVLQRLKTFLGREFAEFHTNGDRDE